MSSMDVIVMITFAAIFMLLGLVMPFINDGLSQVGGGEYDLDTLESELGTEAQDSDINVATVIFSIIKMFFWTFGALPFFLDGVFLIFRVWFFISIVRTIRGN